MGDADDDFNKDADWLKWTVMKVGVLRVIFIKATEVVTASSRLFVAADNVTQRVGT